MGVDVRPRDSCDARTDLATTACTLVIALYVVWSCVHHGVTAELCNGRIRTATHCFLDLRRDDELDGLAR